MKKIYNLFEFAKSRLIGAIFLILVLFILSGAEGCSNNPVNPSNGDPQPVNNDSLIFQKDSLVLRSSGIDSLRFYCLLPSVDSCRIEFTGLTNIDSTKGVFSVSSYATNDSILKPPYLNLWFIFESYGITDFNRSHNYYYPCHYFEPLYTLLYLAIRNPLSNELKYIILKNIKIYKVKPQ